MGQNIRVSAKWRDEIDLDKLAMALLDYLEHLTDEERQELLNQPNKVATAKKRKRRSGTGESAA